MLSGVKAYICIHCLFIHFCDQWCCYGIKLVSGNEIPIYDTALVRNKDLNYDGALRDPLPGTNQISGAWTACTL